MEWVCGMACGMHGLRNDMMTRNVILCRMTERNKLNRKLRPFLAPVKKLKDQFLSCRKIPKISPGTYIFQRPFSGLIFGGAFAFQNRLGQLLVGRKFTIFALFYFVFEGKFQVQAPWGAYIRRGDLTEGFLRYDFGGLIFGGPYTQRSLFSELYGITRKMFNRHAQCNDF